MLTRFAGVIANAHMDTTDMRLVLQKEGRQTRTEKIAPLLLELLVRRGLWYGLWRYVLAYLGAPRSPKIPPPALKRGKEAFAIVENPTVVRVDCTATAPNRRSTKSTLA